MPKPEVLFRLKFKSIYRSVDKTIGKANGADN